MTEVTGVLARLAIKYQFISPPMLRLEVGEFLIVTVKKDLILNPKPRKRKATIKNIISAAKEQGLSEQEIAKKLGVTAEFE